MRRLVMILIVLMVFTLLMEKTAAAHALHDVDVRGMDRGGSPPSHIRLWIEPSPVRVNEKVVVHLSGARPFEAIGFAEQWFKIPKNEVDGWFGTRRADRNGIIRWGYVILTKPWMTGRYRFTAYRQRRPIASTVILVVR
jgi:hypothetical protein